MLIRRSKEQLVPLTNTHLGIASRCTEILQTIERAGIRVPRGNRFEQLRRLVSIAPNEIEWYQSGDPEQVFSLLFGVCEILQLQTICQFLPLHDPRWQSRARELCSGHFRIDKDKKPLARSFQSELYWAARMSSAGVRVEPMQNRDDPIDFKAEFDGWRLGVEVKRVNSTGAVLENCVRASSQLARSKMPGLIALDLTEYLLPNPASIRAHTFESLESETGAAFVSLIGSLQSELPRRLDRTFVVGIVIHASRVSCDTRGLHVNSAMSKYFPWGDADARLRPFAKIWRKIMARSPMITPMTPVTPNMQLPRKPVHKT